MPAPARLRLAVVTPYPRTARWVQRALDAIRSLPNVTVELLIVDKPAHAHRLVDASRAFHAFLACDDRCFRPSPCAYEPAELDGTLSGITQVAVPPAGADGWSACTAMIDRLAIDLVIDFTGATASLPASAGVRSELWRLAHDGVSASEAASAAVLGNRPTVTTQVLAVCQAEPVGVIGESVSRSDDVSVARALDRILWKSASLVSRTLRRRRPEGGQPTPSADIVQPMAVAPVPASAARLLRQLPGWAGRIVARVLAREAGPSQWVLLRGRSDGDGTIRLLEEIMPTPGRFWADPCLVAHDDRHFVFFEEFSREQGRGHLSVAALDDDGRWTGCQTILERPYHLSYPFVFQIGGQWFLLPESSENRTVELYRCERFPDRWVPHAVIMSGVRAVDTTLLEHGGRWWLFTNIADGDEGSPHDELCVFSTDDPLSGSWRPHARNPIVSDVRQARPAGRFFWQAGRLVRPSQDCSRAYGWAVRLNVVEQLTEREYRETCIGVLAPGWDDRIVGTHTWSQVGSEVWLDARLRRSGHAAAWRSRLPADGLVVPLGTALPERPSR